MCVNCNEIVIKADIFIELFTVQEEIAIKVNIFIELFVFFLVQY